MNIIQQLIHRMDQAGLWERKVSLRRNEFLKQEGTIDTNLYLVENGSLRVFVVEEQEEMTIRFAYEGSLFAALDSFITEEASDLYIQAIKKCSLKQLSKKSYMEFLRSSKENLQLWQQIQAQLIHQQMERERDLLTSSPLHRYQRVLKRSPHLFQLIPHKLIASYLRMTPETLSRIKSLDLNQ